jgi:hypothetical protein
MNLRAFNLDLWLRNNLAFDGNFVYLTPKLHQCPACDSVLSLHAKQCDALLVCRGLLFQAKVFMKTCTNRQCSSFGIRFYYDGRQHCIVNQGNTLLFVWELVLEYLLQFVSSAVSVAAWWKTILAMSSCLGLDTSATQRIRQLANRRGLICELMVGAAELVHFPDATFRCCSHPVLTMDGLVLSVKRNRMPVFTTPHLSNEFADTRACLRKDRQLPQLSATQRRDIESFVKANHHGIPETSQRRYAQQSSNSGLALLFHFYRDVGYHCVRVHDRAYKFGLSLLKSVFPAISLMPRSVQQECMRIAEQRLNASHTDLDRVQKHTPVYFGIYLLLRDVFNCESAWRCFHRFTVQLSAIVELTIAASDSNIIRELLPTALQFPELSAQPQIDELWSTGSFFPSYPILRKINQVYVGTRDGDRKCTKDAKAGGDLAEGVMLYYCGLHSKCLGFTVQDSQETPRTVYEIVTTRFDRPPEFIVYDNACNLSEYCLNRVPHHFRYTQFMVDGFHFKSHSNCATTFDSGEYKSLFKRMNTSLNEQKNSQLTRIKYTAPKMRYRTLCAFLRFSIGRQNIEQMLRQT